MPLVEISKTIWANAPKRSRCRKCGDEFPLEIGDTAATCDEWVSLTMRRLPKPVQLPILLDLAMWVKICFITTRISQLLNLAVDINTPEIERKKTGE